MNNHEDMSNDHEIISRKRKNNNNHDFQISKKLTSDHEEDEDNDFLTLSLSFNPSKPDNPLPPPPPTLPSTAPAENFYVQQPPPALTTAITTPSSTPPVVHRRDAGPSRPTTARRKPSQAPREGKSDAIPAPYPWATTQRATVHSITYLLSNQINTIKGEVQCKRCEKQYEMDYDLREKFVEVGTFIAENKSSMRDRAPAVWMNPVPPPCKLCGQENSVRPVMAEKKKSINWLFLLLGQMLGCCTLEQLKYFCKHTKNHRTGAKDRVLYLTYLGLCKQLDPSGPFDR